MRSPTAALLWEMWRQHRWTAGVIAALTVAGRLVDRADSAAGAEASPLTVLLAMAAFVLLLGLFNYTEPSGGRGLGRFPRRLFALPVTSLRLVTVPLLAGIVSIELLYLLWLDPLSRGGSASPPFVAVILAALMVFYLWTLWVLERAGSLRLITFGVIAVALFVAGMLPSLPVAPPAWRSELVLAGLVAAFAVLAFLWAWQHVARLRAGGGRRARGLATLSGWIAAATPARRRTFVSAASAHFWFEWRSSGMVLPALVSGVLLIGIMPVSWLVRGSPEDTFRLLLAALASPIVLAVPVGIAFSKPTFWSEDMAVPAFVAVRPLSSADLVAIKVKVAAASAMVTWLVVLAAVAAWLPSWGNLDDVSRLAIQIWAFHGQSVAAVYGIAALVALGGIFLTWRFLVSRLWSGLSGRRSMLIGSVAALVALVIAGLVTDAGRLPGWLLADPARFEPLAWTAAAAVIAKYWAAAYAWRDVPRRYLRLYALVWLAGTASFLMLGLVVWGIVRIYLPVDADRLRSVVILLALLAVPLARVGYAPSSLTRNRHR
jgi:hypothetical protein